MIQAIQWHSDQDQKRLELLNQLELPQQKNYCSYTNPEDVARAIEKMIVRGAPAIGISAAYGLVLAAHAMDTSSAATQESRSSYFKAWITRFKNTRPTAVNLFWALDRMRTCSEQYIDQHQQWLRKLEQEATAIHHEDIAACKAMGQFGTELFDQNSSILTHCNTGALATGAWGTALGVIRSLQLCNKLKHVYVDETRPYLQGSRLTAWELTQENIPCSLITDSMAAYFMQQKKVDAIIVGADRIACNGDTANKIGTYSLAVLAKHHNIPFYVAAPTSTFDQECSHGDDITIEIRSQDEVKKIAGHLIAPKAIKVEHPAFDVTPNALITSIITEKGIARAPYTQSLTSLL